MPPRTPADLETLHDAARADADAALLAPLVAGAAQASGSIARVAAIRVTARNVAEIWIEHARALLAGTVREAPAAIDAEPSRSSLEHSVAATLDQVPESAVLAHADAIANDGVRAWLESIAARCEADGSFVVGGHEAGDLSLVEAALAPFGVARNEVTALVGAWIEAWFARETSRALPLGLQASVVGRAADGVTIRIEKAAGDEIDAGLAASGLRARGDHDGDLADRDPVAKKR